LKNKSETQRKQQGGEIERQARGVLGAIARRPISQISITKRRASSKQRREKAKRRKAENKSRTLGREVDREKQTKEKKRKGAPSGKKRTRRKKVARASNSNKIEKKSKKERKKASRKREHDSLEVRKGRQERVQANERWEI